MLALLLVGGLCLVVPLAAHTAVAGSSSAPRGPATYRVLQMNLCLSGMAGCYDPAVVDEAVARITSQRPDAVTVNEACRDDAARIARRTGLRLRFSAVDYDRARLPCIDPGGRGLFGNALLTRSPVVAARDRLFEAQAGLEERRWLCAGTARGVTVCVSHLEARVDGASRRANDAQCAELRAALASYAARGPTVFGGDVNRAGSCAPAAAWTLNDVGGSWAPGIQHVYGSAAFASPSGRVLAMRHTDHDALLVGARLVPRPAR